MQIEELLVHMKPSQARIDVQTSAYERLSQIWKSRGNCTVGVEPWFKLDYIEADIPADVIKSWETASLPDSIPKELALPPRNEFIPTDFTLKSKAEPEISAQGTAWKASISRAPPPPPPPPPNPPILPLSMGFEISKQLFPLHSGPVPAESGFQVKAEGKPPSTHYMLQLSGSASVSVLSWQDFCLKCATGDVHAFAGPLKPMGRHHLCGSEATHFFLLLAPEANGKAPALQIRSHALLAALFGEEPDRMKPTFLYRDSPGQRQGHPPRQL